MSLTNPNTPVSQQDLKDFYDKIKPYMGLYPSAMGKMVGKGDIYSTEERLIGQWTDGKPLYQICLHYDGVAITTNTQIFNNEISALHTESILKVTARYYNDNASTWESEYFVSSSDKIQTILGNSYVYLMYAGDRSITAIDYVIQYTKTTDSPISIGDETDYSTTEKIVGTWIDGSPVYQKTFKFKLTALKTEISIGASVEDAFVTYGYVNNGAGYLLPKALYLSGDMYINSGVHKSNNTVYIETNINELIGKDCVLVVQYTKTT